MPHMGPPLRPILRPVLRLPNVRGPGGGFSPAQVFAGGGAGIWLDPSDISTGFQDSAGSTPQTASGQFTGKRLDKSGRGNHVVQATSGTARPEFDIISGISSDYFDGSDDYLEVASLSALGANMDMFVAYKRSVDSGTLCLPFTQAPNTAARFVSFQTGQPPAAYTNAGTPTVYVNGALVGASPTRGQLSAALTVGSWVVWESQGMDLSAWTGFVIGSYTSGQLPGDIGGLIVCPAQSSATRAKLRKWLGAKVGLSL